MPQPRPINAQHVRQQFDRRAPLDAPQFLYGEITQRMLERLSAVLMQPQDVLDAGCGAGHGIDPLRARYVDMNYVGLDISPALLAVAENRHAQTPSLWQRLRKKEGNAPVFVEADLAKSGLAPESFDLIWSNLALHWHPEPHKVIQEWRRLLRPDKLLMFSVFGPATFQELRLAILQSGVDTAGVEFVDMHDYGDMLLQNGFTDPVMSQEIITLTYKSADHLIDDIHQMGGNPNPSRKLLMRGNYLRVLDALEAQRQMDGTIHLTLEVAYGHAWRAKTLRQGNDVFIPISSIKKRKD